ncbi:ABC transporter permease [Jiangella alkaliphila]|uniref:Monosaccharide ABC transporter membrane protein, CUT2 family n=1 Tax=Jiangella alkaliphila TaxID=419479 RepID=A0A1H2LGD8_9ACTN|nr:ABC transporter permease [Jiangella alkaliphila]SDU79969.1 monosaccharide ABC transporter membrane protein, CUT2 family [Jiangella alkaliphila]
MSVDTTEPTAEPAAKRRRFVIPERFFTLQSYVALILVFLAAIVFSPRRGGEIVFLNSENLLNIVRAVSEIGILAIGMTFVILIAGIDLSVGAILGLAATGTASLLMVHDFGVAMTVLIILVIGLTFGATQGYLSARLGIQAFIVTLAGLQVARGLARIWSGGQGIALAYGDGPDVAPEAFSLLNSRTFNGTVPIPALIFAGVGVIALIVVRKTVFARHVYAIGGNERAARLSGIPVTRIKVTVFAISGLLAALAGIIHAGQLNQGSPNDGMGYELDAIAAVVIGGTSLMGGVGTVAGTLAGALLLGILNNILALNNIDSNVQLLIKGVIIVAAAGIQAFRSQQK